MRGRVASDNSLLFLSYACVEADFALQLARDLKCAGVPLWIDRLDATPEQWKTDIDKALSVATAMIVIISPEYVNSAYTMRELKQASKRKLPIIPLLIRPLRPDEWQSELRGEEAVDFVHWRNERLYQQRLETLLAGLRKSVRISDPADTETRYLYTLITRLESRKTLTQFIDLSAEPRMNQDIVRPPLRLSAIWGTNSPLYELNPEYHYRAPIGSLTEALEKFPHFVLTGAPGVGKTTALERFTLDAAYLRLKLGRSAPLPLLIDLANWDDKMNVEAFIRQSAMFEGESLMPFTSWEALLCLDGLSEMGAAGEAKADMLRAWLRDETAPRQVIISCRRHDPLLPVDLPLVEMREMDENGIRQFVEACLDDATAPSLLDQIFPRKAEDQARAYHLYALARNPAMLSGLVFLHKGSPVSELPLNNGTLLKRLFSTYWLWKRLSQMPAWIPYKEIENALGRLALVMIDANRPALITRDEALNILGEERLYDAAIHGELIEQLGDRVRFRDRNTQEFFAATAMPPAELTVRLLSARFDDWGRRISSRWDPIVIFLSGTLSSPDALIRSVAEIDPYLAGSCIASGVLVSDTLYDQMVTILSRFAIDAENDGRVAAAEVLNAIHRKIAIDVLLDIMRGASWKHRISAAQTLKEGSGVLPSAMFERLSEWDWTPGDQAAEALREVGVEAAPLLLNLLDDENWEQRRGAAWALGILGDKAAVPGLVEALRDADMLVRKEAVVALQTIGDEQAVPSLCATLRDVDWRVRKSVVDALVSFGGASVNCLSEGLNDPDGDIRQASARALAQVGDERILPLLLQVSYDRNVEVRAAVVEALGRVGGPGAVTRLTESLSDTARSKWHDKPVCELAIDGLQQIGTAEALAAVDHFSHPKTQPETQPESPATSEFSDIYQLMDQLSDRSWEKRRAAVKALGQLADTSAVPALIEQLHDEDSHVRYAVVKELARYHDDAVIDALLDALHDPECLVSDAAAEALAGMKTMALAGLLAKLSDQNPDVRGLAVGAIGQIGDASAISFLDDLLSDGERPRWEKKRICDLAAEALERIHFTQTQIGLGDPPGQRPNQQPKRPAKPKLVKSPEPPAQVDEPQAAVPTKQDEAAQWAELNDLLDSLHDADWHVRREAAQVLRDHAKTLRGAADPFVIERLLAGLNDADHMVRWAVVEALAWIKDPATSPYLLDLLQDDSWTVRTAVIRALLELGDPSITAVLVGSLDDDHPMVRETAAEVLGRLREPSAVPALVQKLNDEEPFVRRSAAYALGAIGDPSVTKHLTDKLEDGDPQVRWTAAEMLGRMGDPSAVDALIDALHDNYVPTWETRRICDVVAEALLAIGDREGMRAVERWRLGQLV